LINFHCTIIIPVLVLDSVITHASAWFLDREIHQLAAVINPYSVFKFLILNILVYLLFIVYLSTFKYIIILMMITSRSLNLVYKWTEMTYLIMLVYRCLSTIALTWQSRCVIPNYNWKTPEIYLLKHVILLFWCWQFKEVHTDQQFHKLDAITFLVWKIWSHSTSVTRSYGWLADEIVLNLEILKL